MLTLLKTYTTYTAVALLFGSLVLGTPAFSALSCSVTTAAGCTGTVVLRMSAATNAHAELPNQGTAAYASNVICCTASSTLSTSCSGSPAVVLDLASSSNSHVEQSTQTNYSTSTCLSSATTTITVGYQSSNCTGYDTTFGSMAAVTNAHVGDSSAYTIKICGKETPAAAQSLVFTISTTTIYFGSLSTGASKYASSTNTSGDTSEVQAHTVAVKTNAASGFTLSVQGQTLTHTNGVFTINAIGGTNTAAAIGTEQFGIRATASGGTGTVTSPYAASGFAYSSTATTSSQLGSESVGDSATTTYSIRYIANIANSTDAGSYSANVQYIVTANF
jgi:hypothetical protein